MTAEFAAVMPAVVVVLAACLGGLQLASIQVRLHDAAGLGARAVARGDLSAVQTAAARAGTPSATTIATWREGSLACATARTTASWAPGMPAIELAAESCALVDER